jgi:stress response protein SCP2
MNLVKGQKIKFDSSSPIKATISFQSSFENDISCFTLDNNGKLINDDYMTFYNQPVSPKKEVKFIQQNSDHAQFIFDLAKVDDNISKFVITFSIAYGTQGITLKNVSLINFILQTATESFEFNLKGSDFELEKAIIMVEIYKKDDQWRLNCFGQGFAGGMEDLVRFFGGSVSETSIKPTVTHSVKNVPKVVHNIKTDWIKKRISLEKNLEKEAPKLLDLSKKAAISLQKYGLEEHRAKVALCLDISISMSQLYSSGLIQSFVEKILALGCRLDDDGSIDIFLFGEQGYKPDPITYKDFNGYVNRIIRLYPLESDTRYSTAIEMVRTHYTNYKYERSEPMKSEIPVYVIFLTDGQPSDKAASTRALKNSSFEPIFWQFIGVGNSNFSYLEKLDDLTDRFIDNADFFSVSSLNQYNDEQLYEKLINEYPTWLKEAKNKGLLE